MLISWEISLCFKQNPQNVFNLFGVKVFNLIYEVRLYICCLFGEMNDDTIQEVSYHLLNQIHDLVSGYRKGTN